MIEDKLKKRIANIKNVILSRPELTKINQKIYLTHEPALGASAQNNARQYFLQHARGRNPDILSAKKRPGKSDEGHRGTGDIIHLRKYAAQTKNLPGLPVPGKKSTRRQEQIAGKRTGNGRLQKKTHGKIEREYREQCGDSK